MFINFWISIDYSLCWTAKLWSCPPKLTWQNDEYYFNRCFVDKVHYRAIFQNLKVNPYKKTNTNSYIELLYYSQTFIPGLDSW